MTVSSWVFAKLAGLPPARSTEVLVERDLEAKMPDGAILLADRWYAPATAGSDPVMLIRSPYGRRQLGVYGRLFAERGYQVVIQSCRGTFGSGGDSFDPFHFERDDGKATLDWVADQPWFTGSVGMFGPSYLGLVQWAVAADPPPELKAMAMQVTTARVRDIVYPGGSFALETGAFWVNQVNIQELPTRRLLWSMLAGRRKMARAYTTLPLSEADMKVLGVRVPYYQDWLVHDAIDDPWWESLDWSKDVRATPPVTMLAGWYDIFLPGQLEDFRRLREAGRQVRLTIGPWTHTSFGAGAAGMRDGLDWFDTHLRGGPPDRRRPVRYFVTGSKRWVEADDWPPSFDLQRWHLQGGRRLSIDAPSYSPPDRYRYDPAQPAPGRGGPSLDPFRSGKREQRRRESRPDVLSYTSDALTNDMTIAGPVNAILWARCDRSAYDVFVRLCDVNQKGKSYNICDGIIRIKEGDLEIAPDGSVRVQLALWPAAHTFRAGHRIRVQVSSAAHPLYARNLGGGEPLGTAATMYPGQQEIFHDAEHPSAIELPISSL
jgi:putative CocE/NonD family hydrolase